MVARDVVAGVAVVGVAVEQALKVVVKTDAAAASRSFVLPKFDGTKLK